MKYFYYAVVVVCIQKYNCLHLVDLGPIFKINAKFIGKICKSKQFPLTIDCFLFVSITIICIGFFDLCHGIFISCFNFLDNNFCANRINFNRLNKNDGAVFNTFENLIFIFHVKSKQDLSVTYISRICLILYLESD